MRTTPYTPGEYIHDMHVGVGQELVSKLQAVSDVPINVRQIQIEIEDEGQLKGLRAFLDATRQLFYPNDRYMNKMLIAADFNTAVYLYDNHHFGIARW